jgi:hypothetical protein
MPVPPGTPLPKPGESSLGIGSKEEKGIKESRKMFKQIGRVASKVKGMPGAIGAIGAGIESVMPFLETLAPLFQAFEPILTISNAMFTAFAGAITVELIPALQPLFTAMIAMIPVFSELGTIVGQIILIVLVPLVDVFTTILPPISSFLLYLVESEGFIILVNVAIGAFVVAIGLIAAPLGIVIGAVIILTTAFDVIATIINEVVMPAIGTFIMGIAIMIDAITFGMAGAVNYVNDLLGTLPSTETVGGDYPEPFEEGIPPKVQLMELQRGADAITKSGMFHLDAGEAVSPASEVGLQTSLLEEIRDLQREQLLEVKWRTR